MSQARQRRPRLLRQKRVTMRSPHCQVDVSGMRYTVNNLSRFGISIYSKSPFGNKNDIVEVSLFYGDSLIGEYKALLIREEATRDGLYEIAFETLDKKINLEKIEAMVMAHETIERHYRLQKSYNQLPSEYRKISRQMLDSIYILADLTAEAMANVDVELNVQVEKFEEDVKKPLKAYLSNMVDRYLKHLEKALEEVNESLLQLAMDYLMQRFEPLVGYYRQHHLKKSEEDPVSLEGFRRDRRRSRLFSEAIYEVLIQEPEEKARNERLECLRSFLFSQYVLSKTQVVKIFVSPASAYEDLMSLFQRWPEMTDGQFEFYFFDNSRRRFLEAHEQLHLQKREQHSNFYFRFIQEEDLTQSDKFKNAFDLVILYSSSFKVFSGDRKAILDLGSDMCAPQGSMALFAPNVEGHNRIRKYLSYGAGMPLSQSKDLVALLLSHSTGWVMGHEPESWNLFFSWSASRPK